METNLQNRRKGTCDADYDQHCRFADKAAKRAVKDTFAILGVNVDDPASVESFREDLRFGKRLRKFADRSTMALAVAVTMALVSALWIGIYTKFRGGP